MELTRWELDADLVRAAVFGTGAFFDWYSQYERPEILAQYETRPYIFDVPSNGQAGPQLRLGFQNGAGRVIMEAMERLCRELGVEVTTKCRAIDAEIEDGKICAIKAITPQETLRISCKVCILACGSWMSNPEVVDKIHPEVNNADLFCNAHLNPNCTGDGLSLSEKAGALIDWNSFVVQLKAPVCSFEPSPELNILLRSGFGVWVNLNAKRFIAEPLAAQGDVAEAGHILIKQPKGVCYCIFSQNTLHTLVEQGQLRDNSFPFCSVDEIQRWFAAKSHKSNSAAIVADSIEELAGKLSLDAVQLQVTMTEYDTACQRGEDSAFFKDAASLIPTLYGPYFALRCKVSTVGAFGGVRVNAAMQAYSKEGTLVKGMYVAGDFASGRHISVGGIKKQVLNDMSWALSSGFIAGTSAANELL